MIGKTSTTVTRGKNSVAVRYHATQVVYADENCIILDTGGWFTPTTKRRMNEASEEFGLGYRVYAKKGTWFVDYKNETFKFHNNVRILTR